MTKPSKTIRRTIPNATVDPGAEEMLHSLFDGRAKYRVTSSYDPTRQDKPKRHITLAPVKLND